MRDGYTGPMALIGVISDTHGRLDQAAYNALADCGHIIHAGDIGNPAIIRELETLAPVTAVLGNNDFQEYGPSVKRHARVTIEGVRFLVAHFPHDVDLTGFGSKLNTAGDFVPDVCIHGHTHLPRLEYGRSVRPASYVLNPGSASLPRARNPRSIAKINIVNTQIRGIWIESLEGELLMSVGDLVDAHGA